MFNFLKKQSTDPNKIIDKMVGGGDLTKHDIKVLNNKKSGAWRQLHILTKDHRTTQHTLSQLLKLRSGFNLIPNILSHPNLDHPTIEQLLKNNDIFDATKCRFMENKTFTVDFTKKCLSIGLNDMVLREIALLTKHKEIIKLLLLSPCSDVKEACAANVKCDSEMLELLLNDGDIFVREFVKDYTGYYDN